MPGVKGKSGRKKIPRALRLVDGKRLPQDVPPEGTVVRPESGARCPAWLPAAARAEWDRLAPELTRLGLLTTLDATAFADLCFLCSELRWCAGQRRRWTVTERGNPKLHPVLTYRLQVIRQLMSHASEFGMTPAARDRVEVDGRSSPTRATDRGPDNKPRKPITSRRGRPV